MEMRVMGMVMAVLLIGSNCCGDADTNGDNGVDGYFGEMVMVMVIVMEMGMVK